MKKLILLELAFLFLATTFSSSPPPPGWYQQTLPVNDQINDIFFLDSLNGWVATNSDGTSGDTAYVMKTSNGGSNWAIQERSKNYYTKLQFLNSSIGYLCGSTGAALVWKTTNGGDTWFELFNFGLSFAIDDIQFLNEDTGWVTSKAFDFGGIWKTTNGGLNWVKQLNGSLILQVKAISILNNDTGWAINSSSVKELYRTTNGGLNWNVQYTFAGQLNDVCFLNPNIGIITAGVNYRTTDGGFNWEESNDGGIKVSFANDSVGWAGNNLISIQKTTNQGISWFSQITNVSNPSTFAITSLNAWAGGNKLVHTTNGGLTDIQQNNYNSNINYYLNQNYPNPFNPKTFINYELRVSSFVQLKVFDIQGREVKTLIKKIQNEGNYSVEFDAGDLTSGIYFYRIEITDDQNHNVFTESKKMILLR